VLSFDLLLLPLFLSSFRPEFPKITPNQSISDYLGYLGSLTSYVATLARENLLQNEQQGHLLSTSKEIKGKSKPVQATSPARELGGDKRAAESMMMENDEDGGTSGAGKRQKTTEHPSGPLNQTPTPSAGSLLPTTTITSSATLHSPSIGETHLVVPENTLYIPTKEEKAQLLQDLGAARKNTINSELLLFILPNLHEIEVIKERNETKKKKKREEEKKGKRMKKKEKKASHPSTSLICSLLGAVFGANFYLEPQFPIWKLLFYLFIF